MKYGRLVILRVLPSDGRNIRVFVQCDCGTTKSVRRSHVMSGDIRSCGCLSDELLGDRVRTHGLTKSREYRSWRGMRTRCEGLQESNHRNYTSRGITVCDRWMHSFENFYADMGPKPTAQHSLDRIDNDGNYEPGNCRWATKREQAMNRRVELARGEGMSHAKLSNANVREILTSAESGAQLAKRFSVSEGTISAIRVGRNWRWMRVEHTNNTMEAQ